MGVKENRGGQRLGAGRPATGRERGNFTTTLGAGTLEYLTNIHPQAGRLIDTLVTLYRVECNHVTPEQVQAFISEHIGTINQPSGANEIEK